MVCIAARKSEGELLLGIAKKKAPGGERVPGGTEDYELLFREPKDCDDSLC